MKRDRRITTLLIAILCSTPVSAEGSSATELPGSNATHEPRVCIGAAESEGKVNWNAWKLKRCTANQAVIANTTNWPTPRFGAAKEVRFTTTCCPLPATDILLDEHHLTDDECPDGFVATSSTAIRKEDIPELQSDFTSHATVFRCTRINKRRYQLGAPTPAIHWGRGESDYFEMDSLLRGELPLAIRQAIGRQSKFVWNWRGCIGRPIGALLVAKTGGKRCHNYQYRQLQYRGISGDPPKGTPVAMFPDCMLSPDPFNPAADCTRHQ